MGLWMAARQRFRTISRVDRRESTWRTDELKLIVRRLSRLRSPGLPPDDQPSVWRADRAAAIGPLGGAIAPAGSARLFECASGARQDGPGAAFCCRTISQVDRAEPTDSAGRHHSRTISEVDRPGDPRHLPAYAPLGTGRRTISRVDRAGCHGRADGIAAATAVTQPDDRRGRSDPTDAPATARGTPATGPAPLRGWPRRRRRCGAPSRRRGGSCTARCAAAAGGFSVSRPAGQAAPGAVPQLRDLRLGGERRSGEVPVRAVVAHPRARRGLAPLGLPHGSRTHARTTDRVTAGHRRCLLKPK